MSHTKAAKYSRYLVLISILGFITWQVFAHALGNKLFPSVHGLCPFGGLESFLLFISKRGSTLPKVFSGTMGLFFITIVITLLFRRSFCGMICPLGALQEISAKIGSLLLKGRKFTIPPKIDKILRYYKYFVLILAVVMAWMTGSLWIQRFDPWAAYAHIPHLDELFSIYLTGFIILVSSLFLSAVYDRFFCKYACPMGAFNALLGLISPFKIKRKVDTCTSCGLCTKVCPVNIDVANKDVVKSAECINCQECVTVCPEKETLDSHFFNFKLNPVIVVAAVFLTFTTGIFAFQFAGFDRYSAKTPPLLHEIARAQGLSSKELKENLGLPEGFSKRSTARDIEYNITFVKMAELNNVPVDELKKRLGLEYLTITRDTLWGDAYGEVKLEIIAAINGTSVSNYISFFKLGESVNKDTRWKEIRTHVEKEIDTRNAQSGCGHH
jgi:Pyruvate/2-oxoacid:ferredoxin oxidoreductase delta subunit